MAEPTIHDVLAVLRQRIPRSRIVSKLKQGTPYASLLLVVLGFWRFLWYVWRKREWYHRQNRWLRLTSPLYGSCTKFHRPYSPWGTWQRLGPGPERWRGNCPCCKRPIDAEVTVGRPRAEPPKPDAKGRYAFVITLWGSSRAYVLGALVLGHSIRNTGTKHHLVCLHANDVPDGFIRLLSLVWECRAIVHLDAAKNLSWEDQCDRFDKVFTKLRGMQLTDFEKIVMMDIDLLVLKNIDDLFDLHAPAAMRRGMNDTSWPYKHGDKLDGRRFFLGKAASKYSWGQGTGINAGVMLWQPSDAVFEQMAGEIAEINHPEHVRGNGPEQDYLSRFWADAPWTHISVEYNFQLHQMFNSLHPHTIRSTDRVRYIDDPSKIRIVHFSGEPTAKPWHRVLDAKYRHLWPDRARDAEYTELFAQEFHGYWLWVNRDKSAWDKVDENRSRNGNMSSFFRGDDTRIYEISEDGSGSVLADLPKYRTDGAVEALDYFLCRWFDAFELAEQQLKLNLVAELAAAVPEIPPSGCQDGLEASTIGVQKEASPVPFTWKSTWFSSSPPIDIPTPSRATGPINTKKGARMQFRSRGGWQHEQAAGLPSSEKDIVAKASVACGAREGARFVVFSDADSGEQYFSESDEISGIFVKVVGQTARPFKLHDGDLSSLQIWAGNVSPGVPVLFAAVGLQPEQLSSVLSALRPLGLPPGPISSDCWALAAAGTAYDDVPWDAAHASTDLAYASFPLLSRGNH